MIDFGVQILYLCPTYFCPPGFVNLRLCIQESLTQTRDSQKYTQRKIIWLCIRKFIFSAGNTFISHGHASRSTCPGQERNITLRTESRVHESLLIFHGDAMHQQSDFEFSDVIFVQETSDVDGTWSPRWTVNHGSRGRGLVEKLLLPAGGVACCFGSLLGPLGDHESRLNPDYAARPWARGEPSTTAPAGEDA